MGSDRTNEFATATKQSHFGNHHNSYRSRASLVLSRRAPPPERSWPKSRIRLHRCSSSAAWFATFGWRTPVGTPEEIVSGFVPLDAAGKDGVIRHLFTGMNPQGTSVFGFKQPPKVRLSKIDASFTGRHEDHEKAQPDIQKHVERMAVLR
jgi:hypothetical protein